MASTIFTSGTIIAQEWLNDVNTVVYASSTVALLPAASSVFLGQRRLVTDANASTFYSVVAGGGSIKVPVYSDGTNWRIG
jgi:hypothetical protein